MYIVRLSNVKYDRLRSFKKKGIFVFNQYFHLVNKYKYMQECLKVGFFKYDFMKYQIVSVNHLSENKKESIIIQNVIEMCFNYKK